ncbi:MAG TPA: xylulokinase [bacterium]|nr:xylulokinase [bacterium]
MSFVIGCDVGTSGTKAIVVSESGKILSKVTVEYPLSTPHPGWAEQDPDIWVRASFQAIAGAVKKARVKPSDVKALGFSGQMHSSVFLDKQGKVLRPALLWCDTRTHEECLEITRKVGESHLRQWVSNPALEGFTLPKILWVKKHEPKTYAKIAQVLMPKDYVRYKLTGALATEVSDAAGTLYFDVKNRRWSKELLGKLGIPLAWFPQVVESQQICGRLTAQVAKQLGLREGCPVVGGGADNTCGAVGNGIIKSGDVMASLGTSGVFFAHSDKVKVDPGLRVHSFCHSVPDKWYLMGVILSAGFSLQWYRDTLGLSEKDLGKRTGTSAYKILSQMAGRVAPGSEGLLFLPYLMGERTPHKDAYARGAFVGMSARHGRAHFARAVFEGITFAMRDSLEIFRELKVPIRRVVATGGGAANPFQRQMQADIYGEEVVTVNSEEGPAYGAAILAMVGAKLYPSVPAACSKLIRVVTRTQPNTKRVKEYDVWYGEYRELYPALKGSFRSIGERLKT